MSSALPPTKKIYIFRHGETDWNKAGLMQGHTDIPLNESGRKQALALQKFFAQNPVEVFLSSDLSRARETAEIARGSLKVPHEIDPRQRETNLGMAEGLTREEIASKIAPDAFERWVSHEPIEWEFRFPNAESKTEHQRRVHESLLDYLKHTSYSRIAFCSHGGSMRRLIYAVRPNHTDPVMIQNCMLYEFNYEPTRGLWLDQIEPIKTE
jgi:broad specificity phosphatase PhoE